MASDDQTVIRQFQRWWDKCQVSLNKLNEQAEEAEGEMWEHLKELGYE